MSRYDGLGLAALVRERKVSPTDLVDEVLARIDRLDPQLGAIVHRMEARARRRAAADPGTGPFAGVPLLVKDLLATIAGEPTRSGSGLLRDHVPDHDSEVVRRLERAGFVPVAKTKSPEFGLLPVTEPLAYGPPCRNPWDLERTPGGSSGASAACVAAGIVPIATGGDGGGSIRIPASCTGLFGLKPSRGRVPCGPDQGELWQGCAGEHVLTRSVRDSAAVLDAIAGPDPGAPYSAPPPARPFLDEVGAPPGKLRIGWTSRPPVDTRVHPDCVAAVEDAARLLASLGHEVVEAEPTLDRGAFSRDFVLMLVGETAADVVEAEGTAGRRARAGDVEPGTALLHLLGERQTALEFALACRRLRRVGRSVAPFFERHDLLLTPVLATPPVRVGELAPKGFDKLVLDVTTRLGLGGVLSALGALEKIADQAWGFAPFTALWNVTGQPAMSVPLHWSKAGLPIGVQLVGRSNDEATLLRLARQLEEARPWADRHPPIFA